MNNKINKAVYTFRKWSTCTIKIFIQEKSQLEKKLKENEQQLHLLELTDTTDATIAKRYKNDPYKQTPAGVYYSIILDLLFRAFGAVFISEWLWKKKNLETQIEFNTLGCKSVIMLQSFYHKNN